MAPRQRSLPRRERDRSAIVTFPRHPRGYPRRPSSPPRPAPPRAAPPRPASTVDESSIARSPFTALGLCAPVVRAVLDDGDATPSAVVAEGLPHVLARRDGN